MRDRFSWVHRLCFDAYFEDALMKMRARTGLGTTYALFTALNEYFYEHGYMDEKGYHYHRERYRRPLVDDFERRLEAQDANLTLAILQKEQELKKLRMELSNAFRNWNIMNSESKAYWREKAVAHKELAVSKKILALTKGEDT